MTPVSCRLRLFVKNSNPAVILPLKFINIPAGVHSNISAPIYHCQIAEMSTSQDWIGLYQD